MTSARWLPALLAGLALAGCASMSGFPEPIVDQRAENAELAQYVGADAIARYEACADKIACRNAIVDARLHAVDLAFYRFQRKVYGQESRVSLGSNMLVMALGSVATITTTRPLAAGAGLLSGGRDAYQKQVLSASLPLLFQEMIARRREVLLRVRQGQMLPAANYSLFQALADVGEYELAGSIPAAAAELGASAGAASRTAQAQLDALRAQVAAMPVATPAPQPIPVASPPPPSMPVVVTTGAAPAPVTQSPPAPQPSPTPAPKAAP